ncbi:MAG: hypothetical protein Q9163_003355 [Psora crenata]
MPDVLPSTMVTSNARDDDTHGNLPARSPYLTTTGTGPLKSSEALEATEQWAKLLQQTDPRVRDRSREHQELIEWRGQKRQSDPRSSLACTGLVIRKSGGIMETDPGTRRTNTSNILPPKMRSTEEETHPNETAPTNPSNLPPRDRHISRADSSAPGPKVKGRFVGPRKRDVTADINEDESEGGDRRPEGMDAAVFSQPIGYIPQFPPPPKYIKVRSQGKKEKDFNRIFLAQELRGRTGVEIAQKGGRPVMNAVHKVGDVRKDGSAIWAMEFSKDGKYLAAGGGDYTVRVWAVLSTKGDRHTHESEEDAAGHEDQNVRLQAPVFKTKTVQEYAGHTASVLDLSWSKNNFLLSSSMDKTVRLWHVSREECLCCFKHSDFVTSIQFHPRDDRFFIAGSLDSKLRLWSIPDKSVAYWNTLPDLITAVAFAPDGKTAMAGCLNGLCLFYETEGLKYQTQLHVRSAHGKNAKGSKVTGIQAINYPPDDPHGEVKILITSNDSRVRVYNLRDKGLELKLKGNENSCSQIHATFSDDAKYIICGSEDRKAFIWSTGPSETEKDKRPVEMFEAHQAIVTTALMAPTRTRQLLSASGDPLYDLCNPPPITLVSRAPSRTSSKPHTDDGSHPPPTPAASDLSKRTKPEESPAYLARCAHPDGNIIVTADFLGNIKVFRQDCAFHNRHRNNDSTTFSKKMLGRTNSVGTKNSTRSSRNSFQLTNHSSDRILSWRQSINSTNGSLDSFRQQQQQQQLHHQQHNNNKNGPQRNISPHKLLGQVSLPSSARLYSQPTLPLPNGSPLPSPLQSPPMQTKDKDHKEAFPILDPSKHPSYVTADPDKEADPLMLQGEQSYMSWNRQVYQAQAAAAAASNQQPHLTHLDVHGYASTAGSSSHVSVAGPDPNRLSLPMAREATNVSRLSSEEGSEADASHGEGAGGDGAEVRCRSCRGTSFRVRIDSTTQAKKQILVCNACGTAT